MLYNSSFNTSLLVYHRRALFMFIVVIKWHLIFEQAAAQKLYKEFLKWMSKEEFFYIMLYNAE